MLNTVLETAGEHLGLHNDIIELIQGDLCKFLLQSSQTNDPILLSLVLRTIFNMFCSVKGHLKVQFEVFFTSIHMGIVESNSATNPQKELALESLLDFCREPVLMVDLYTNYDCDVHCTNLFEVLTTSLCKGASPQSQQEGSNGGSGSRSGGGGSGGSGSSGGSGDNSTSLTTLHVLAFESLLEVLNSIGRRCQTGATLSGVGEQVEENEEEEGASLSSSSPTRPLALPLELQSSSLGDDLLPPDGGSVVFSCVVVLSCCPV